MIKVLIALGFLFPTLAKAQLFDLIFGANSVFSDIKVENGTIKHPTCQIIIDLRVEGALLASVKGQMYLDFATVFPIGQGYRITFERVPSPLFSLRFDGFDSSYVGRDQIGAVNVHEGTITGLNDRVHSVETSLTGSIVNARGEVFESFGERKRYLGIKNYKDGGYSHPKYGDDNVRQNAVYEPIKNQIMDAILEKHLQKFDGMVPSCEKLD